MEPYLQKQFIILYYWHSSQAELNFVFKSNQ